MYSRNLHFKNHYQFPFEAYVAVVMNNNPAYTKSLIKLDVVYLKPIDKNREDMNV